MAELLEGPVRRLPIRVFRHPAREFWHDQRVDWWYSQNMLVFVSEFREDLLNRLPSTGRATMLDIVHPRAFECFRTEASVGGDAQLQLYPFRVIEAGYEGHDILQIDTDTFLALAKTEGRLGEVGWRLLARLRGCLER